MNVLVARYLANSGQPQCPGLLVNHRKTIQNLEKNTGTCMVTIARVNLVVGGVFYAIHVMISTARVLRNTNHNSGDLLLLK